MPTAVRLLGAAQTEEREMTDSGWRTTTTTAKEQIRALAKPGMAAARSRLEERGAAAAVKAGQPMEWLSGKGAEPRAEWAWPPHAETTTVAQRRQWKVT